MVKIQIIHFPDELVEMLIVYITKTKNETIKEG